MRSPPLPPQPPQPQAPHEPVDILGSKLCPVCPQIVCPLSLVLFLLTPFCTAWFLSSSMENTRRNTVSTKEVNFSPFSKDCHYSCFSKMTVNPNAELGSVVTKLNSPPRSLMLPDPWRTAGSLRHENMHTGREAPCCDVPSLELFYLFNSSPTHLSPAASSLFWLGLLFPYGKFPAHTQSRKWSQNSTFSSLRPATSSSQPHPFCNYQVYNSCERQMKGAAVLQTSVFSTQI